MLNWGVIVWCCFFSSTKKLFLPVVRLCFRPSYSAAGVWDKLGQSSAVRRQFLNCGRYTIVATIISQCWWNGMTWFLPWCGFMLLFCALESWKYGVDWGSKFSLRILNLGRPTASDCFSGILAGWKSSAVWRLPQYWGFHHCLIFTPPHQQFALVKDCVKRNRNWIVTPNYDDVPDWKGAEKYLFVTKATRLTNRFLATNQSTCCVMERQSQPRWCHPLGQRTTQN